MRLLATLHNAMLNMVIPFGAPVLRGFGQSLRANASALLRPVPSRRRRDISRQEYLKKREEAKLEELKEALEDEKYLFQASRGGTPPGNLPFCFSDVLVFSNCVCVLLIFCHCLWVVIYSLYVLVARRDGGCTLCDATAHHSFALRCVPSSAVVGASLLHLAIKSGQSLTTLISALRTQFVGSKADRQLIPVAHVPAASLSVILIVCCWMDSHTAWRRQT